MPRLIGAIRRFNAQVLAVVASLDVKVVRERLAASCDAGLQHGLIDAFETGDRTAVDDAAGTTEMEAMLVVEADCVADVQARIEQVMALPVAQQNVIAFATTDDITELEDVETMGEHA